MFEFPSDIPFNRLYSIEISWISFSASGFRIDFENRDRIGVFFFREFCDRNILSIETGIKRAISLIGHSISEINIIDEQLLLIKFSNRQTLKFHSFECDMENYLFKIDGMDYVI